ncbi:MAG: ABC transporter permease subunit [Bacillota bacterium]
MKEYVLDLCNNIGYPRLIIGLFLFVLLIMALMLNMHMPEIYSNILIRTAMNGILVLAMVPSIQAGLGPNFALPIGIVCGLVGAVISIETGQTGYIGFFNALFIAIPLSIIAGIAYGLLLNKVKGQEMTVGTYAGFSIASGMCIFWLLAPLYSPKMIWPYGGSGLRVTITLDGIFDKVLNNFLSFKIFGIWIPTGLILFWIICSLIIKIFFRTKTGLAVQAAGSNPGFARSSGINVDITRIIGNTISTMLGAIGILVYAQSYGFLQLYTAPLYMAFPAVAAILIGGASINKATIIHVFIGTFLFQSLLVVALPVTNLLIEGNIAEIARIVISNGMILYALTRTAGGE